MNASARGRAPRLATALAALAVIGLGGCAASGDTTADGQRKVYIPPDVRTGSHIPREPGAVSGAGTGMTEMDREAAQEALRRRASGVADKTTR